MEVQVVYPLSSRRQNRDHSDVKPGSVRDVILTLAESMCTGLLSLLPAGTLLNSATVKFISVLTLSFLHSWGFLNPLRFLLTTSLFCFLCIRWCIPLLIFICFKRLRSVSPCGQVCFCYVKCHLHDHKNMIYNQIIATIGSSAFTHTLGNPDLHLFIQFIQFLWDCGSNFLLF